MSRWGEGAWGSKKNPSGLSGSESSFSISAFVKSESFERKGEKKTEKSKWDMNSIAEDSELDSFVPVLKERKIRMHIEFCCFKYQRGVELHRPIIPIELRIYEETEVLKDYVT